MIEPKFEAMEGFHKLESLWSIEYRVTTLEPFLTNAATEETKEIVDIAMGKETSKDLPDAVPLIFDGKAAITGNSAKGVFRHIISSQLRNAGVSICFQEVKYGPKRGGGEPTTPVRPGEAGQRSQCPPDRPCFACTWFGTPSRQGALYFSMLKSAGRLEEVLAGDPIPLIALRDDYRAVSPKASALVLIAPVREGVEFRGRITGENLSDEIIGAIKEVQDMSKKGFVKFGGLKTRGFGSVEIEVLKVEKYGTAPFKLEREYAGDDLKSFLEECQKDYHRIMSRGTGV